MTDMLWQQAGRTRGKIKGFDEHGSGSRRQTEEDALQDQNYNRNKANKGRTEAAENGSKETAASIARAGSLHSLLSEIRIPLSSSNICLESEDQEVTVLASDPEAAL